MSSRRQSQGPWSAGRLSRPFHRDNSTDEPSNIAQAQQPTRGRPSAKSASWSLSPTSKRAASISSLSCPLPLPAAQTASPRSPRRNVTAIPKDEEEEVSPVAKAARLARELAVIMLLLAMGYQLILLALRGVLSSGETASSPATAAAPAPATTMVPDYPRPFKSTPTTSELGVLFPSHELPEETLPIANVDPAAVKAVDWDVEKLIQTPLDAFATLPEGLLFAAPQTSSSSWRHAPNSTARQFLRDSTTFFTDLEFRLRDLCGEIARAGSFKGEDLATDKAGKATFQQACASTVNTLMAVQALFLNAHSDIGRWWLVTAENGISLMRKELADFTGKHSSVFDVGDGEGKWRERAGSGFTIPAPASLLVDTKFIEISPLASEMLSIVLFRADVLPPHGNSQGDCDKLHRFFDALQSDDEKRHGGGGGSLGAVLLDQMARLPSVISHHVDEAIEFLLQESKAQDGRYVDRPGLRRITDHHDQSDAFAQVALIRDRFEQDCERLGWYGEYLSGLLGSAERACEAMHDTVCQISMQIRGAQSAYVGPEGGFRVLPHPNKLDRALARLQNTLAEEATYLRGKYESGIGGVDAVFQARRQEWQQRVSESEIAGARAGGKVSGVAASLSSFWGFWMNVKEAVGL